MVFLIFLFFLSGTEACEVETLSLSRQMSIRDDAKLFFKKGKFGAAAEAYTEAITQEPGVASLYQNRALCHQKLAKWVNVVADASETSPRTPLPRRQRHSASIGLSG